MEGLLGPFLHPFREPLSGSCEPPGFRIRGVGTPVFAWASQGPQGASKMFLGFRAYGLGFRVWGLGFRV